jgi:mRNA interferase YafQ
MLELLWTSQFKKDLKKAKARGKSLGKLNQITALLQQEKPLLQKHHNHKLSGEYNDHWECHIEPDWLLIYLKSARAITLVRTGTHSDLF